MEAINNSSINPIMTVVYPDTSGARKHICMETKVDNEDEIGEQGSRKGSYLEIGDVHEDDRGSVIIGEVENKVIEVEEDSNDEVEMVGESLHSVEGLTNTKATQFVIVNAANISLIDTGDDETESANKFSVEDIQIKDELSESITADMSTNYVLENDPMDLLELNNRSECTSSTRSQEEMDDDGDDTSSSSAQTGSSSSLSVLDWIKEYPWLLYEEGDDIFGYCLYCDTKINIKSQRTVKQHGLSLYHKERCENYLAFCEEEEKNGLSTKLVEIKQEFGTDSNVAALKLKRKSQNEALNNFNWRRWLRDCPWLNRDTTEGTVGYCKYCFMHFNVEFSYLRERHQESAKHKEAEKQYGEFSEQNKCLNTHDEKMNDSVDENQSKNNRWLELIENEPTMAQCKICGTKLCRNNFIRHLRTNLHLHNEKVYIEKQKASNQSKLEDEDIPERQQNWEIYAKQHPWLVSDPIDPKYAYCKYCKKRIIYGSSAAKRSTHENSTHHKYNENEFKSRQRKKGQERRTSDKEIIQNKDGKGVEEGEYGEEENQDDEDEVEEGNGNDRETNEVTIGGEDEVEEKEENEVVENEEEGGEGEESKKGRERESGDEYDSKKRIYKLTEEWINQYSWCKRYHKDPGNFFYCIYCKIPLSASYSRSKHQATAMHIASEEEYLNKRAKKRKMLGKKQINESNVVTYDWAISLKGNFSMYSCKYCRVRISNHYSKKQHAASKIHQFNENIYKSNRRKLSRQEEEDSNNSAQNTKLATQSTNISPSKVVIKSPSTVTLIKQWQKKFPWLSYKRSELRSNYGHCKICDCSLYIRSLKHVLRHVRSGRHARIIRAKRKQKLEKEQEDDDTSSKGQKQELQTSSEQTNALLQNQTNSTSNIIEFPKAYSYKSTIIELKKRFSWIESSDKSNYGYCHFCNTNIPLKILFLRNHSNSQKHRFCVKNFRSLGNKNDRKLGIDDQNPHNKTNERSENRSAIDEKCDDNNEDDDVIIVEEDNEEILLSEQDENWTVKSETIDEHEELDYLLQQSFNNNQNNKMNVERNGRKSVGTKEHPIPKRIKRSHSFRRLNDGNTSLVASLLTTPLTLASCLGPLIQQQIQQASNTQTFLAHNNTSTTLPSSQRTAVLQSEYENSYDLFFKSVSETMKKLPVDLAAEGKVRVMQIICDLELQALKREQTERTDFVSTNTSGLSYQPTSTSASMQSGCNSVNSSNSVNNDIGTAEQNLVGNETVMSELCRNTDVLPPVAPTTQAVSKIPTSTSSGIYQNAEKSPSITTVSPIIGVMDKNGLQTIQLKTSVVKQVPKSTTNTTITTVANAGIRCIPFKNLSQPVAPARIQVPVSVTSQSASANTSPTNTQKNVINFRNIQITKRVGTPPTSTSSASTINNVQQQQQQQEQQQQQQQQQQQKQTSPQSSTVINKSPQKTFITNIQPQLQRWGCSVNDASSNHTPTSSTVNHQSQQTSTPIPKKT